MMPHEIQAAIESVRFPPDDVFRSAVEHAGELAPSVISLAEKAATGAYLTLPEDRLLFAGLHALGAARCTALYRPLMRLLRRPEGDLDHWLGDALTETIPRIVLSVFDGDPDPLIAAIEERNADSFVRWRLFEVLAQLTVRGLVPRAVTIEAIDRFEREGLAEDGDYPWEGWKTAIMALGLVDRFDRIRAAWNAGRLADRQIDWKGWVEEMKRVEAGEPADSYFTGADLTAFDDPISGLSWIDAKFREPPKPAVSPNRDPAAAIALGEDEIGWLTGFLSSRKIAKAAMSMDQIDGFFTGLIAGPHSASFDQHIAKIWRGFDPQFDDAGQKDFVDGMLSRHWDSISRRLEQQFPHAPVIARHPPQTLGCAWAQGFVLAVDSNTEIWRPLVFDDAYSPFLDTIVALAQDDWRPRLDGRPQRTRQQYVDALPLSVLGIHGYWRGRPDQKPPRPPTILHRKIGRNERCLCGSGKKYKYCCGAG